MKIRVVLNEKGAIAIIFIALLPVIFAMLGFAADIGYAFYVKESIQNIADAAAASASQYGFDKEQYRNTGVKKIDSERAIEQAIHIVEEHNKYRGFKIICNRGDVTVKQETVTVRTRAILKMHILPMFGTQFKELTVTAESTNTTARKRL